VFSVTTYDNCVQHLFNPKISTARSRTVTTHLTTGPPDNGLWHRVRGLLRRCERVDIVVAFTMPSGVALIESELRDALLRGVHVRLLTGDYLGITKPGALRRVLSLDDTISLLAQEGEAAEMTRGVLELRVIESSSIREASFHPKAWLFEWTGGGVGFVGSSNLSRAALITGIEWNLAVDKVRDPETFAELDHAFDALWHRATPVTHPWIDAYAAHVARLRAHDQGRDVIEAFVTGIAPDASAAQPITPRPSQREALDALAAHRAAGHQRGLIVMATGLGKTWVAAFDAAQCGEALGRRIRVLVIAHRVELLAQAGETFAQHDPDAEVRLLGDAMDLEHAHVVLASVQLLTRGNRLDDLDPGAFDYVVIDEVHHAAAPTYRRILAHLEPSFLLGLTATPVRGDGADIASLFGGVTVYEATLRQGIERGALVPFRYKGLRDTINYAPIPWRAGRFDPDALMEASQTQKRLERLWEAWEASDATRTLVFCCSIAHARKMAQWLVEQGVRAVAVHSGADSADRAESITALGDSELDAVCTVDLFNEGVDVPSVDRVVMLRPTDSRVVFMQQLGRGLRTSPDTGKTALEVVDFVGNHRAFLDRVRLILEISSGSLVALRAFLQEEDTEHDLPPGCDVDIELEARHMLLDLMPDAATDSVVAAYQGWRETHGHRPQAAELQANGYNVRVLRTTYQSWFLFVLEQGDLNAAEREVLLQARGHFEVLEHVAWRIDELGWLTALLEAGEVTLDQDHAECQRLTRELDCVRIKDNVLSCAPGVEPQLHGTWTSMMREVVEYLSIWRVRVEQNKLERTERGFSARVIQASGRPILKLPDRKTASQIPEGTMEVRLPDQALWSFRLVKIACNVAHPVGAQTNRLGDLMREWFGAHAGAPGTAHHVFFWHTAGDWRIEPVRNQVNGVIAGDSYALDDLIARLGEDTLVLVQSQDRLSHHTTLRAQEGDTRLRAHIAFVRDDDRVRYHGVASRTSLDDPWSIPEVDFETWRTHGGSGASRALPTHARAYAEAFVSAYVGAKMHGQLAEALGHRCRIIGVTRSGSIRIDGGEGGFGERTISQTDLGWVLLARMDARHAQASVVTEQVVNALRYLDGTPKSSTRYIDTRWALVLTAALGWDVICPGPKARWSHHGEG
jgi:superfamily II DNA or RNA helicase/HKD family nuclease